MSKYKTLMLIIFLLFLVCFYKVNAEEYNLPLIGKKIYLDAGHGGIDPGASYKDILEKDINLEIVYKLKTEIEAQGGTVFLTRVDENDLSSPYASDKKKNDLQKRVNIINENNPDLYISVHLNADPSTKWKGPQIFYDDINENNKVFADILYKVYKKNINTTRKVKEIKNLYMFRRITVPGVLLEVGFLSNPGERYILKQEWYQKKIAKITTEGIINYLNK